MMFHRRLLFLYGLGLPIIVGVLRFQSFLLPHQKGSMYTSDEMKGPTKRTLRNATSTLSAPGFYNLVNEWRQTVLDKLTPVDPIVQESEELVRETEQNTRTSFAENQSSLSASSSQHWIAPFNGTEFLDYVRRIDQEIAAQRERFSQENTAATCRFPLYTGEFGYEMAGIIPWIHNTSRSCPVETRGLTGTKYLYYFSMRHEVVTDGTSRAFVGFPKECPFGAPFRHSRSPHFHDAKFPKQNWTMPPWKQRFRRDDVILKKPLLIIFNKYTTEWKKDPINFIGTDALKSLLERLTPEYYVIYHRLERKELEDENSPIRAFDDKEMIRNNFVDDVVVLDDISANLSADELNLLILSLGALSSKFISVQGGNSVVASLFGGDNTILCKKGHELKYGDYTYYHRFSGTKISVVRTETALLRTNGASTPLTQNAVRTRW